MTNRDVDYIEDRTTPLSSVMWRSHHSMEEVTLAQANEILKKNKLGKLPVINSTGCIVSLISRTDLKKARDFPLASKDTNKQLLVGAAIGTRPNDKDRVKALVEAGVNVVVIDSSQGDSMYQHDMIRHIKKSTPKWR